MDEIKVTTGRTTMNIDFGPSRADDAMGRHIDVVSASVADELLRALVAKEEWKYGLLPTEKFRRKWGIPEDSSVRAWLDDIRRAAIAHARKP